MKIHGTGKSETLVGTSSADIIDAGAGNDVIIGGAGADTITGGKGADTFIIQAHSQYDVITDFNAAEGDTIVFDYGTGAAATSVYSGALYDGLSFATAGGTCDVHCVDINADGVMDTQLSINGDNVFILGYTPDHVNGACLLGC
jgi:Ca2+-binding RTX toxin-like protein